MNSSGLPAQGPAAVGNAERVREEAAMSVRDGLAFPGKLLAGPEGCRVEMERGSTLVSWDRSTVDFRN
jgi:hypothetical protein